MSFRTRPHEDPGLFDDLPLQQDPRAKKPAPPIVRPKQSPPRSKAAEAPAESLPLFADSPGVDTAPGPTTVEILDGTTKPGWRPVVPISAQLSAGLLDLGIVLAVGLVIWLGLYFIGVSVDLGGMGILALFLLPFSFLYEVFPLAFWGSTAGMVRVGLSARSRDGKSLSFSQAAIRWFASVLTVCLLGLPWILTAITRQSLADRLSGSQTLPAR